MAETLCLSCINLLVNCWQNPICNPIMSLVTAALSVPTSTSVCESADPADGVRDSAQAHSGSDVHRGLLALGWTA